MKTINTLLISGLVLLFACGTALAWPNYTTADGGGATQLDHANAAGSETGTDAAPVPEPATMLLLGSGIVALGVGVRKKKK